MYTIDEVNFCDDCDEAIEKPYNLCKSCHLSRYPDSDPEELKNTKIQPENIKYPDE